MVQEVQQTFVFDPQVTFMSSGGRHKVKVFPEDHLMRMERSHKQMVARTEIHKNSTPGYSNNI